jgi:hypothetical protein
MPRQRKKNRKPLRSIRSDENTVLPTTLPDADPIVRPHLNTAGLTMPVLMLANVGVQAQLERFVTSFNAWKRVVKDSLASKEMIQAIDPEAWSRIKLLTEEDKFLEICPITKDVMELTDEEVLKILRLLFPVSSTFEATELFRKVKLTYSDRLSVANLTSYVSSLFDILKKLEDNNIQICPKTLKKSILEGINPLGSRERLRLIFDETPIEDSGESYVKLILTTFKSWIKQRDDLKSLLHDSKKPTNQLDSESGHASSSLVTEKATSRREDKERKRQRIKVAACYGCGHRGHNRPQCPNSSHKLFVKHPGQCSKPIAL